ncbi:MAG: cytochrome c biogenesis CcdA family protein [Actinomycetota bacterium]
MGAVSLAFIAGIVSFTSPCCLPLMPGYVAYVSGTAAGPEGGVAVRSRVLGSALLFVVGFAAIFTAMGAGASAIGPLIVRNRIVLERVAGLLVVVMGLLTIGIVRVPFLMREARIDLRRVRPGPLGAVPLGMAFAIGWTPCVGPVLASILAAAATTRTAWAGAGLLFVYALGLGIPFLLLAWGHGRASTAFSWLRRHGRTIEVFGGTVLIAMGVLMLTGQWTRLFTPLIRWFVQNDWPPI